jgi:hypothetical protein
MSSSRSRRAVNRDRSGPRSLRVAIKDSRYCGAFSLNATQPVAAILNAMRQRKTRSPLPSPATKEAKRG